MLKDSKYKFDYRIIIVIKLPISSRPGLPRLPAHSHIASPWRLSISVSSAMTKTKIWQTKVQYGIYVFALLDTNDRPALFI